MRRNFMWAVIVQAVIAAPVWAAAPFGFFDGIARGGNSGQGLLQVVGWALDDDGVERVEVYVDEVIAGPGRYGRHRPGVAVLYPGYPDSDAAGFGFPIDTTHYTNGNHTVSVRVTSNTGETAFLNERVMEFLNTSYNLVPFGKIEFPNAGAEMFGNCDINDPNRRYSVIEGYALDLGIEQGDTGVKWVELLINGSLWSNTHIACDYIPAQGGYVDCFGLLRTDIEALFPSVANSLHSGFRFVLDIGVLTEVFGYNIGFHELTIRAGDVGGQVANIAEIPVTFWCDDDIGNEGSFGHIDAPVGGLQYSGVVRTVGWALDFEGVNRIIVYVDGAEMGDATHGLPRADITSKYPGYPESAAPGWFFDLDTTPLSDGQRHLQVQVEDDLGVITTIGESFFWVNNDAP